MGTNLKYIPVEDILLVPDELLEEIEGFDAYAIKRYSDAIASNPYSNLGVFVDREADGNTVKGFLWSTYNPIEKVLHVHALSVDEAYRGKGIVGEARNLLDKERLKRGATKLRFSTKQPEIFERWGFKRTDIVVMEG
jgi:N-acetylglutamate synthase-like GNAT family acetyltransferase